MKKLLLLSLVLTLTLPLSNSWSATASTLKNTKVTLSALESNNTITPSLSEKISKESAQLVLKAYLANLKASVAPLVKSGRVTTRQTEYYFVGYNDYLTNSQRLALKKLILAHPLNVVAVEKAYLQKLYLEKTITKTQLDSLSGILPLNSANYNLY